MIEVHPGFFVGDEADEQRVRGQPGWFFIHACKEPYHRQALGSRGVPRPRIMRNTCSRTGMIG